MTKARVYAGGLSAFLTSEGIYIALCTGEYCTTTFENGVITFLYVDRYKVKIEKFHVGSGRSEHETCSIVWEEFLARWMKEAE